MPVQENLNLIQVLNALRHQWLVNRRESGVCFLGSWRGAQRLTASMVGEPVFDKKMKRPKLVLNALRHQWLVNSAS